ncbi:peptidase M50 [Acidianus sulfidivorans JP7]|uniref:Peptidase M50 n=1 Tax=Acidianus sulfidivorans JP7 TaxID=619593 RepID=A0A2U9IQP7_9CREN|nr:site-2 protease family protein [Acidianus sulfidivorans]AWR98287.1 peptidase M50 [Acidianus sulfidivorans JP7]
MSLIERLEYKFQNLNEVLAFILAIFSIAILAVNRVIYYGLIKGEPINSTFILLYVGFPIIAATVAIVPHELAHRQVARRYGCLSRFTLSFSGFLATTLINLIAFFGLVFFSGYTLISCVFSMHDRKLDGVTAAAGPITNIGISILSYIIATTIPASSISSLLIAYLFYYIAEFNAVVAFFNLLPFWVLDGLKVFRWNIAIWGVLIVISLILLFLTGEL